MLPAGMVVPERWTRSIARLRGPLITVGLLLGANLLAYGLWAYPTNTALQAQVAKSQAVRGQLQELLAARTAIQDLVAVAPAKKDLPQAIARVSALGRRTGVAMPDMSFQPDETASPSWARIQLQFNARGTYANVRRFMAAIEGADEPFVIESMVLNKDGEGGQVTGRFVLSLYTRDG